MLITDIGINTRTFKNSMSDINRSIAKLDEFTDNLQNKVDLMLKAQQTEMVNSYKTHMFKIKQQFDFLKMEIKKKDAQILDYENEGKMSNLIKRIQYLQGEQKTLLAHLQKKKIIIKELQLQKLIQKSEIKRLEQNIKALLREKAQINQFCQPRRDHKTVHVTPENKLPSSPSKKLGKLLSQDKKFKINLQKIQLINPQIKKQKKKQTHSVNHSYGNQIERLFSEMMKQLKKNINQYKRANCQTLAELKDKDKKELLMEILSNQHIIDHFTQLIQKYEELLKGGDHKGQKKQKEQQQRPLSLKFKLALKKPSDYHFPSISSSRVN